MAEFYVSHAARYSGGSLYAAQRNGKYLGAYIVSPIQSGFFYGNPSSFFFFFNRGGACGVCCAVIYLPLSAAEILAAGRTKPCIAVVSGFDVNTRENEANMCLLLAYCVAR